MPRSIQALRKAGKAASLKRKANVDDDVDIDVIDDDARQTLDEIDEVEEASLVVALNGLLSFLINSATSSSAAKTAVSRMCSLLKFTFPHLKPEGVKEAMYALCAANIEKYIEYLVHVLSRTPSTIYNYLVDFKASLEWAWAESVSLERNSWIGLSLKLRILLKQWRKKRAESLKVGKDKATLVKERRLPEDGLQELRPVCSLEYKRLRDLYQADPTIADSDEYYSHFVGLITGSMYTYSPQGRIKVYLLRHQHHS